MSTTTIRDQLRAVPFLTGLTDSAFHQLARLVEPARYASDEALFEEGAERRYMAIIISGAVAIEKLRGGRPVRGARSAR
jgi:signal-transduction protein with cAMP-binding, CBS, and nucleotidyltransferase domain